MLRRKNKPHKELAGEDPGVTKIIVPKCYKYLKESWRAKRKTMLIPPSQPLFLVFTSVKQLSAARGALQLQEMKCRVRPSWHNGLITLSI